MSFIRFYYNTKIPDNKYGLRCGGCVLVALMKMTMHFEGEQIVLPTTTTDIA